MSGQLTKLETHSYLNTYFVTGDKSSGINSRGVGILLMG